MSTSLNASPTLVDVLRFRACEAPEATACIFLPDHDGDEEVRFTYAELDRRARAVATTLIESGATGERAFLLYPPGPDYLVAFLGCLYAGVIAIPAYPPDLARRERSLPRLLAILDDAEPRLALTTSAIQGFASALAAGAPALNRLQWMATDTIELGAASRYQEPEWEPDQLAFLQYTSGSTGTPKGVMLSHANLLANLATIRGAFRMRRDDVLVSWLPPYHDMGLIGAILQPLYIGAQVVLMSPTRFLRRPRAWLEAITRFRATVAGGPNFGYELCVRKVGPDQRHGLDLSSLEVLFVGAEPIRATTLSAFSDAFAPCGFQQTSFLPCYGLAEATLFISGAGSEAGPRGGGFRRLDIDKDAYEQGQVRPPPADGDGALTLVGSGLIASDLDVRIVNPRTGRPCADGEVGAIWVAGENVARGYWEREDATQHAFGARLDGSGPYLRTGDLGFIRDNELFVSGREDDLIIVRGRNLYPQDIETAVESSHAQLRPGCCAAFAVDAAQGAQLVVAVEVATAEAAAVDGATITRTIQEAVATSHGLRVDEIVLIPPSMIPKTSSGKIQRRACRVALLDGSLPRIAPVLSA